MAAHLLIGRRLVVGEANMNDEGKIDTAGATKRVLAYTMYTVLVWLSDNEDLQPSPFVLNKSVKTRRTDSR
jgi:hypothetical protein